MAVAGLVVVAGCTVNAAPSTTPSVVAGASPSASGTATSPAPSLVTPTVVVRALPPTKPSAAREVVNDHSLVDDAPDADREPQGPVTFSVSGDTVVIDNEIPEQPVLVSYRDGRKVRTLRSPDDCCIDLWIEGERYWTLGANGTEWVVAPGADRLTGVRGVTLPPDTEDYLAATPGTIVQWGGGRLERTDTGLLAVPSDGLPVLLAGSGTPTKWQLSTKGKTLVITDPGFTARIPTRASQAYADLLSHRGGYAFYQVSDGVGPNGGYIYQFTTTGTLVHTYTLHRGVVQEDARTVVITDDAQVYQLVLSAKTVRVLRLAPN